MYIKKEDFQYFEGLCKNMGEPTQKEFLNALHKAGCKRIGEDITKIQVVDDAILNVQGIEPNEMITRTMIKKAYKAAKGGN
jgi:CMP-2-keto-3-deoxyoctulosonic acid synthetase